MRPALLLTGLLLTAAISVAPTASADHVCYGYEMCLETVCWGPDMCLDPCYQDCIEPICLGPDVCIPDDDGTCAGLVDAACQRTVCTRLSYDGCERYETLTCVLYADVTVGGTNPTDYTCIPNVTA